MDEAKLAAVFAIIVTIAGFVFLGLSVVTQAELQQTCIEHNKTWYDEGFWGGECK